ncbi:GNAT family N-acetyltransferase [Azospirillum sp. B510]|uniref:GNAT family N-acetyltransferase n=1 Tax=Azospirillum sp. (strain B510) TaxID=137722 RepID=UPI00069041A1|nr:GNAT family N-acetyltransferase [Azospirillum sp. B510]
MTSSEIRPATFDDLPGIQKMMVTGFAATGYADLAPYDPQSGEAVLKGLIVAENAVVLVAVEAAGLVGLLVAVVVPYPWNGSISIAQQLLWWVEPACRTGAGRRLLAGMEEWAIAKGAKLLASSCNEAIGGERATEVYRRRFGFRPIERHVLKGLMQCP